MANALFDDADAFLDEIDLIDGHLSFEDPPKPKSETLKRTVFDPAKIGAICDAVRYAQATAVDQKKKISVSQIITFINNNHPHFQDQHMSTSTVSRWLAGKTKGARGEQFEKRGRPLCVDFEDALLQEITKRNETATAEGNISEFIGYVDFRAIANLVKLRPEFENNEVVKKLAFTDNWIYSVKRRHGLFRRSKTGRVKGEDNKACEIGGEEEVIHLLGDVEYNVDGDANNNKIAPAKKTRKRRLSQATIDSLPINATATTNNDSSESRNQKQESSGGLLSEGEGEYLEDGAIPLEPPLQSNIDFSIGIGNGSSSSSSSSSSSFNNYPNPAFNFMMSTEDDTNHELTLPNPKSKKSRKGTKN